MEPAVRARLEALGEVIVSEDRAMPVEDVERYLPDTVLIL
eukprot:gene1995-2337_t